MTYTWAFFSTFTSAILALVPVWAALVLLIVINGLVIGRIEGWRPGESLYHAFINATTVGYGDYRPTRPLSRILSVINALVGLIFTGILVGAGGYAVQKAFDLTL